MGPTTSRAAWLHNPGPDWGAKSAQLRVPCGVLHTKVRRVSIGLAALVSLSVATSCGGDDDDASDAAPEDRIDAMPSGPADAAVGVVCEGALANYSGSLEGPAASNDSTTLEFRGLLGDADVLRISAPSDAAANGVFELPDATWSVEICINDADESCSNALSAYSGTLTVTSVEDRFRANVDRVVFADDLQEPTCSASVSQSAIDVAILGPI